METNDAENTVRLARLEDPIPPHAKHIRYPAAEHARLVEAAAAAGLTPGRYLRNRQRMDAERPEWRVTGDLG